MRALAAVFLIACVPAAAAEAASWPPPDAVVSRMHDLQEVMADPASTGAQREAARKELSDLLKSPAGQAKGPTPDEKPAHPPRAAIQPFGQIVKPAPVVSVPVPGVATVDVIQPPRITIAPQTGHAIVPSTGGTAVAPLTGHIQHETPYGYIDPRTGQFTPK
jgi:hypothetical protein